MNDCPVRNWKGLKLRFGGSRTSWNVVHAHQRTMRFKREGAYARVSLRLQHTSEPKHVLRFVFKSSDVMDMYLGEDCHTYLVRRRNMRAVRIYLMFLEPYMDPNVVVLTE